MMNLVLLSIHYNYILNRVKLCITMGEYIFQKNNVTVSEPICNHG